jgi:hypothetical protein
LNKGLLVAKSSTERHLHQKIRRLEQGRLLGGIRDDPKKIKVRFSPVVDFLFIAIRISVQNKS